MKLFYQLSPKLLMKLAGVGVVLLFPKLPLPRARLGGNYFLSKAALTCG